MFVPEPVTIIDEALQELGDESRSGWPSAAHSQRVIDVAHIVERAHAELLRAVEQWDAEGLWGEDGTMSAASWLASHTTMSRIEATRLVRAARLLREHDATAAALASGAVSCTQVDTLAMITRNREDLYAEGEEGLLRHAAHLSADTFAEVARVWRSHADDAVSNTDAYAVHERMFLHASKMLGGTVRIDGELDHDAGETFLNALAAARGPDSDDRDADGRTGSQQNADCLVQIAQAYLSGATAGERPDIAASLVIDFDTLMGSEGRSLGRTRRELRHLGPIAQEVALRLACDCTMIRAVLSARSEALDLGRSTRVVSRAQRRALVLRDCGCGFPGCDRPPEWCDAHHIWHWVKGGPTDLRNLVLLCRRHHVLVHEGGWKLARGPDGRMVARRPDGSELVLAA